MHAESVYLFRHALLREAAYGLHLPGKRRELHGMTARIMAALVEQRPDLRNEFAIELADHCRFAEDSTLREIEIEFARLAAEYAGETWRHQDEIRMRRQLLAIVPEDQRPLLHNQLGSVLYHTGNHAAAVAEFRASLENPHADAATRASATNHLGIMYMRRGEAAQAETLFRQGLQVARESGIELYEQAGLLNLSALAAAAGRREEAADLRTEALALARSRGDYRGEITVRTNAALDHFNHGELSEAEAAYKGVLKAAESHGLVHDMAQALTALGGLYSMLDRPDEAGEYFERAWKLSRETGNVMLCAVLLNYMGALLSRRDELEAARSRLHEALDACREVRYAKFEASTLCHLGMVLARQGQRDLAESYWKRGLKLFETSGHELEKQRMVEAMGSTLQAAGTAPLPT